MRPSHTPISLPSRWMMPFVLLCCMVSTVSADTFGLFTYTNNGTSITITDYPEAAVGSVVIPSTIVGKPVTGIGYRAFANCSSLTSLTIPSSVTSIGDSAFEFCTGLTSVMISVSVTSIGKSPFIGCSRLTSILVDAANPNYSSVDGVLFNNLKTSLIQYPTGKGGTYKFPTSVSNIGDYTFYNCTELTSVTIPDGVTSIGMSMFYNCWSLTEVVIPTSVTSIGAGAFRNCWSLASLTIPSGVTSIGGGAPIWGGGWGGGAFANCWSLTNVMIPSGCTSIGGYAFSNCWRLTSMTIPYACTSIGEFTFSNCTGMTSVSIPASVTSIGNSAFEYCSSLNSVTIPKGVTSIGEAAFEYCSGLTSVMISPSVAVIWNQAFFQCTELRSAYFLGHAPAIGANVFGGAGAEFKVYYLNGKAGFTSPIWNGYPAVNLGNLSPASVWLHSNGFPADTDLQADPNGDGVNLMLAYALNLDPLQNLSGSMPRPVVEGNQMSLTFYAGSEGVTYAAEFSDDLQTWSVVDLPAPDGNNCRTATVPMTGPRRFVRLVVSYFP